jgi:hypothetical protein
MKTETFTCDICDFKTDNSLRMHDAHLSIGNKKHIINSFHVCSTCYGESPKGVFQKAFNAIFRKKNK